MRERDEDPEIARILESVREPVKGRLWIIPGLVGAFAAAGVVFVGVARMGAMSAWSAGFLVIAVIALGATMWSQRARQKAEDRAAERRRRESEDDQD